MTDYRSEAEKFVTEFLDYVEAYDILDKLNRQTQKMERSPGVAALIKQAESVFPKRADDGKAETDKLTSEQIDEAIAASPNVLPTREMFSRKVQASGGTRDMLRRLYEGDPSARDDVQAFLEAEDGVTKFAKE